MSSAKTTNGASVRPKIRNKSSEKLIGEPLERRSIRFEDRDGIERYYPALHIKFCHTMVFTKYYRPPLKSIADSKLKGHDLQNNDSINKWIANAIAFEEMIKTLLRLQHNQVHKCNNFCQLLFDLTFTLDSQSIQYIGTCQIQCSVENLKFWSTLIHERSLQICFESYMRCAPRAHDLHNFLLTEQMKVQIKRIHILVFKLYLRICSFAESKINFISESSYGNLVYENYLMDVPKIIDLCVLYSNTSYRHLLSRMLSNVIQCQPRYKEDLLKGCATISDALFSIQQKIGSDDNQFERNNKLSYFQWSELQSMVSRITDISVGLVAVLQSIPETAQLYRNSSIDKSIVEFYNRVFPSLQNELNKRLNSIENNDLFVAQNRRQITVCRSQFLIAFRHIIENCFLTKLLDKNLKSESKVSLIDGLFETLTFTAFERGFINDYCVKYPMERDFEELSKQSEMTQFNSFDKTRIDYLKSVVRSNFSEDSNSQIPTIAVENEEKVNGFVSDRQINESDIELESKVQYIREIMPELGSGFIEKCLIYFDYDNERVLNAILENNLPPHLESLDRTLQKLDPKQTNTTTSDETEILCLYNGGDVPHNQLPEVIESRDNVFNNDDFDIFRNKNIDLSRIHSGKREKTQSKMDNQFKEKIMNLHHKTLEEEENRRLAGLEDYDDEYDDTYEDDTKIDLPNDKLMDELEVKTETKDDKQLNSSNETRNHRDGYNNHKYRNRKYNNFR